MARLENNSKELAANKLEEEDWGVYNAGRIADLYSRVPECRTREFLQKAAELTGSEFIMVFDGKGKEILASNGYVVIALDHPHHSFFAKDSSGKTVLVDMDFIQSAIRLPRSVSLLRLG